MSRPCPRLGLAVLFCAVGALADEVPSIRIPRVTRAPTLSDFLDGHPREAEAEITDFRQFDPQDGVSSSRQTAAYLSYDDTNLYVVFVCKDDPKLIRARIAKRKDILTDDRVTINIDTFRDHKRAYFFDVNPYGVQMDGITTDGQGDDFSFETLWYTEGKITEDGYIVLETIPFRSLRFPDAPMQRWGIALARFIQRNNEMACWPHISRRRLPQFVGQFGEMEGLEGISGGRNMQVIPYGLFSPADSSSSPAPARRTSRNERDARAGMDAKTIIHDAFTLDVHAEPRFQSDRNRRAASHHKSALRGILPERRPFFTENAQFFDTPEELFFSRRIVDPQFGARLTGKIGRWAIGALTADDRAASVLSDDPFSGGRAGVGVVRVQREFGRQSHIGMLFTDREFGQESNRVGSLDLRLRLSPNWTFAAQAASSTAERPDSPRLKGQSLRASISQVSRHLSYQTTYIDRSPGFRADLGFIPRVDIRDLYNRVDYRWRPGRTLVSFGPTAIVEVNWNRLGQLQDWKVAPSFNLELSRLTYVIVERAELFELFQNAGFRMSSNRFYFATEWFRNFALTASYTRGLGVNYYPAAGLDPFVAHSDSASLQVTFRPTRKVRLDESYLYSRLGTGPSVFNNHIVRSKVNWQFTRTFSLRTIVDYNAVLPTATWCRSTARSASIRIFCSRTCCIREPPSTPAIRVRTRTSPSIRSSPPPSGARPIRT